LFFLLPHSLINHNFTAVPRGFALHRLQILAVHQNNGTTKCNQLRHSQPTVTQITDNASVYWVRGGGCSSISIWHNEPTDTRQVKRDQFTELHRPIFVVLLSNQSQHLW